MNEDPTLKALLDRLQSQAVTIHSLCERLKLRDGQLVDERARAERLETVAKGGQERLSAALGRATKAEDGLELATEMLKEAKARNPQRRRIDTIDEAELREEIEELQSMALDPEEEADRLLRWLREPVGGAS